MPVNISVLGVHGQFLCEKTRKNFAEKFGGKEKMSTFAIPNENGVHKTSSLEPTSSLKRLIYCTRSKYRENTIYREALILLKEL